MSDQVLQDGVATDEAVPDEFLEGGVPEDDPASQTQMARRTEKFRRQHDVLVDLAGELDRLSKSIETLYDAKVVRSHLNHFAGKLVVHLAKEDKSLYPKLLESSDTQVVVLTRRFIREMGDLSATFDEFTKRWVGPADILVQKDEFQAELAGIVSALAKRIDKENNELYTLADDLPDE